MDTNNKTGNKMASELFKVKGDWNKQSQALKVKYPKLTNEDLKFEAGSESDLFKRIETRLGKNHTEVLDILKNNQKACC